MGKSKCRGDKPGNCKLITLVAGSVKILGVHFSSDKTLSKDKNFSDLLVEMRAIIKTWKIRNLTLEGNQSSDILQHSQNRPTGDRWLKF